MPKRLTDPITGKSLHQSTIAKVMNRFYKYFDEELKRPPTKQELLDNASEIDRLLGDQFYPAVTIK